MTGSPSAVLGSSAIDMAKYEALYKYFHQHPELSNLEAQTAKKSPRSSPSFRASTSPLA